MNWLAEKNPGPSVMLGLALAALWGAISMAHAYSRTLASVQDSLARSIMIADRLGVITDTADRLELNQEAFLATGDGRFQDAVIEDVEHLQMHLEILKSQLAASGFKTPLQSGLGQSIDRMFALLGESDRIRQARGAAAARAYLQSKEGAVADVRWQAAELRLAASGQFSTQMRAATTTHALMRSLMPAPPHAKSASRRTIVLVSAAPGHAR